MKVGDVIYKDGNWYIHFVSTGVVHRSFSSLWEGEKAANYFKFALNDGDNDVKFYSTAIPVISYPPVEIDIAEVIGALKRFIK